MKDKHEMISPICVILRDKLKVWTISVDTKFYILDQSFEKRGEKNEYIAKTYPGA